MACSLLLNAKEKYMQPLKVHFILQMKMCYIQQMLLIAHFFPFSNGSPQKPPVHIYKDNHWEKPEI